MNVALDATPDGGWVHVRSARETTPRALARSPHDGDRFQVQAGLVLDRA